jgi:hypothetical protein
MIAAAIMMSISWIGISEAGAPIGLSSVTPKPKRQDERRQRHDDQDARRVDQAERAHVAARLGPEDHHVRQPAGHRGVPARRPVEAVDPAEEGHPDKADHRDEDRHQRDRDRHLRQPRHHVGVSDAPTATPRMVRAPTETTPRSLSGAPASAATRQATSGPNRNGSGSPKTQKRRFRQRPARP